MKKYQIILITKPNRNPSPNSISNILQNVTILLRSSKRSKRSVIKITYQEGEFVFYLTRELINRILEIKQTHRKSYDFKINPDLDPRIYFQYGLSFITNYSLENQEIPLGVKPVNELNLNNLNLTRTYIALDGDIFHQIHKSCLYLDPYQDIVQAHHWLIKNILKKFRLFVSQISNFILFISVFLGLLFGILTDNHVVFTSFMGGLVGAILKYSFEKLVMPRIQGWIWRQIWNPKNKWLFGK